MSDKTAEIILAALREAPLGPSLAESATRLAEALDAAGYVLKAKPRRRAAVVEAFSPNTGEDHVDAFMRRKHDPNWEKRLSVALRRVRPGMMTMPAPAPGWPVRAMSQTERADLWEEFRVIQHSV